MENGQNSVAAGQRRAVRDRLTLETAVHLELCLDGSGRGAVNTGIGFLDHMLGSFARHSYFDLELSVQGDLQVDSHHTVEDTGIVLGEALKEAAGTKQGIRRFGSMLLPMDDALVLCAVDFSGRPYLNWALPLPAAGKAGDMDYETVREFFYAVSYTAGMNIHIKALDGSNSHHLIEAAFKAFAKAVSEAVSYDGRINGVLSAKGCLS